ncbi:glycosyltransferase family 39 protein [Candidatus Daviesbacteria bacterium]|nr:glycosyltransferase family 39 protein [Candidatus Daviesbacteria bacterium]
MGSIIKKLGTSEWLIIFICLFHLIANIIWINLDNAPEAWDQSGNSLISLNFINYLIGDNSRDFLAISDYYPPLVHLITAFFMILFGASQEIGQIIVSLFFLASIIFLYLYTLELFKNRTTALLTAIFYSFLPTIYGLSRNYLLDIPLLTLVFASLYFLEKSVSFTHKKFTIFFAVSFGLALLTKWYAPIYLFVPLFLRLIKAIKNPQRRVINNLLLAILIVVIIAVPWYVRNFETLTRLGLNNIQGELDDARNIFEWKTISYYFFAMTNFQLTWLGMITFLSSIPTVLHSKRKKVIMIFFSMLFIYIVFTLVGNKNIRYPLMLVPLASIVIGYFLYLTLHHNKILGRILLLILGIYFIGYFFALSFGILIDPAKFGFRKSIFIPLLGWIDLINLDKETSKYLAPKYQADIWPNEIILKDLSKKKESFRVLVIVEKPNLNPENLKVIKRLINLPNIELDAPYNMGVPFNNQESLELYIFKNKYVLVAEKDLGSPTGVKHYPVMKQIQEYLEQNEGKDNLKMVKRINSYILPDGDYLTVYETQAI